MPSPSTNYRVAVFGCVTAGKSTLLEAMFCTEHKRAQTGLKCTTMVPMIFHETGDASSIADGKSIAARNAADATQCTELEFNGPIMQMSDHAMDRRFSMYDIPGLNDAKTKGMYYDYVNAHFGEFNVVIFVVDIMSGLNTSDEMDILNMICTNTVVAKARNKPVYTMVVANKVDDMVLDKSGSPVPSGELVGMYEQTTTAITDCFTKHGIIDNLVGIFAMSANDAYIYRMLQIHGTKFDLTDIARSRIGMNEVGKKYNTMTDAKQRAVINSLTSDPENIRDMLHASGFDIFRVAFNTVFAERGDNMIMTNMSYDLGQLQSISDMIAESDQFKGIDVGEYVPIMRAMQVTDPVGFATFRDELLTECIDAIDKKIQSYPIVYTEWIWVIYKFIPGSEHEKIRDGYDTRFNSEGSIVRELNQTLKPDEPQFQVRYFNNVKRICLNTAITNLSSTGFSEFLNVFHELVSFVDKINGQLTGLIKFPPYTKKYSAYCVNIIDKHIIVQRHHSWSDINEYIDILQRTGQFTRDIARTLLDKATSTAYEQIRSLDLVNAQTHTDGFAECYQSFISAGCDVKKVNRLYQAQLIYVLMTNKGDAILTSHYISDLRKAGEYFVSEWLSLKLPSTCERLSAAMQSYPEYTTPPYLQFYIDNLC